VTTLKGFEQPVEYFTIQRQRQQSASQLVSRHLASIPTPFVGREAEISRLLTICHYTIDKHKLHFVTVYGDIGIGKSRLLQETFDQVQTLPLRCFAIAIAHDKRAKPYSFLHDFLAVCCDLKDDTPSSVIEMRIKQFMNETLDEEEADAVTQLVGFLAGYSFAGSSQAQSLKSVGAEQKHMILSRVGKWFHSLAAHNPLLFVVDNLHWLDDESLELLEYLAGELADKPICLLTSARTGFRTQNDSYMRSFAHYNEILLERLSEGQISSLLHAVLQDIDYVPENLPRLIRDRSEGNPLFVEEFLRMLFDNGVFEAIEDGHWKTNHIVYERVEAQLPNGLLALLQARLDELRVSTRRVVQVASVIGPVFWESAVTELSGFSSVSSELADLEKREMIIGHAESVFEGEREYAFRHSLYREVAYAMMTGDNRRAYHHDVAAWLAQRVTLNMDYLEILAQHYLASDQYEQALTAYWAAAADLYERGILPRTLRLIESGWNVARDVPREVALPVVSRLWMLRGQVLDGLDEYAEASAASETALMLMKELPTTIMLDERAGASLSLANSYIHMERYDEALDVLNDARVTLPQEDTRYQAALLRTFGALYRLRGQINESFTYQQQALALAEESGDLRETARTTAMLAGTTLERGDLADALDYYERALDLNRQDNNLYYQSIDLRHLARLHRILFAFDRALELCDEAEKIQLSIGHSDPFITVNRGLCLIYQGNASSGLDLLTQAAQASYQNVLSASRARLAWLQGLVLVGDYAACQQQARPLLDDMRNRNHLLYGRTLLWLGHAQAGMGNQEEAQQTLHDALAVELEYAGCDAWLGYLALSGVTSDGTSRDNYRRKTWELLQQRINSLQNRPELQTLLNESLPVRSLAELI
ncbi:MAG: AAA family ATPase, partial [Anaerolineae bacterium]|nr:AAA family ATPase [Anaerolineae bacterium]